LSVSISRQAISKRFNKTTVAFFKACLELLLARIASLTEADKANPTLFGRVLVVDSTQWQIQTALRKWFRGFGGGASKAACKLQTVIEAVSGKILLFDYHRATRPDQGYGSKLLKILQTHDLILFDLGYYCLTVFQRIQKLRAFFIIPIYYHATVTNPLTNRSNSVANFIGTVKGPLIDCELIVGS
jgi:hypothetical protein